jgi:hypothetical protein
MSADIGWTQRTEAKNAARLLSFAVCSIAVDKPMIETNPIRARIADLQARLASLRGYL